MDTRIVMEELRHVGQRGFDLLIAGACCGKRHEADSRAELVVDSVVQLPQQHSFPREGQLKKGIRHDVHPTFPDGSVRRRTCWRTICNWRKSIRMSIRSPRNPARLRKSHQVMWRS